MRFSNALVIYIELHLIGNCEAILGGSDGEESACHAGDPSSIPGLGRPSREGNGLPIPVFLGFPGGSDGKESVHGVAKSWTQLSD